jgi:hypothetical protein
MLGDPVGADGRSLAVSAVAFYIAHQQAIKVLTVYKQTLKDIT